MSASTIGLRIRRVDMPSPDLLSLTLGGASGSLVLVYRFSGTPRGPGLVDARPRGNPADSFTQRLRKLIEGAAVTALARGVGDRLVMTLRRGDGRSTLLLDAGAKGGRLWVVDEAGVLVAAQHGRADGIRVGELVPAEHVDADRDPDEAALRARGPDIVAGLGLEDLSRKKRFLRRALSRARKSLERRRTKIEADRARESEVDSLRARASEILSHLHAYGAGEAYLEITDYGVDPPTKRSLNIDPMLGAKGESEALFHRARRLERGAEKAAERLRITEEELAVLGALEARIDELSDLAAVDALAEEAARAGVRGARAKSEAGKKAVGARQPYRRFNGHDGRTILVGRGAADNDALTLRHSKPSDLWLHARGYRGAHVIVPLGKGDTCPPELLLDAAALAVHFSAAAGEDRVEVQHTARRYVRKPRGAAPGAVMVDRERVIILRHEPERVARLLASEERG